MICLYSRFLRLSRGVVAWGTQGQAKDCLVGDEFSIQLYSFQSEKPFSILLRESSNPPFIQCSTA